MLKGRGPLAGPVVCAAIYISAQADIDGVVICDSKVMSPESRERAYEALTTRRGIYWSVSVISHSDIDEMNILQASLTGMRRATDDLLFKVPTMNRSSIVALIDGNMIPVGMPVKSIAVVKGDSKILSIAAASVIAKVWRDRLMADLDLQYPSYGFAKHKGW